MRKLLIVLCLVSCVKKVEEVKKADTVESVLSTEEAKEAKATTDNSTVNVHSDGSETLEIHEGPSEIIDLDFDRPPEPTPSNPKPRPILKHEEIKKFGTKDIKKQDNQAVTTVATDNKASTDQKVDAKKTSDDKHIQTEEDKKEDTHPAASCAFGGYLWALAFIGAGLAVLRFLKKI